VRTWKGLKGERVPETLTVSETRPRVEALSQFHFMKCERHSVALLHMPHLELCKLFEHFVL
jgi:hypothetical protein